MKNILLVISLILYGHGCWASNHTDLNQLNQIITLSLHLRKNSPKIGAVGETVAYYLDQTNLNKENAESNDLNKVDFVIQMLDFAIFTYDMGMIKNGNELEDITNQIKCRIEKFTGRETNRLKELLETLLTEEKEESKVFRGISLSEYLINKKAYLPLVEVRNNAVDLKNLMLKCNYIFYKLSPAQE